MRMSLKCEGQREDISGPANQKIKGPGAGTNLEFSRTGKRFVWLEHSEFEMRIQIRITEGKRSCRPCGNLHFILHIRSLSVGVTLSHLY